MDLETVLRLIRVRSFCLSEGSDTRVNPDLTLGVLKIIKQSFSLDLFLLVFGCHDV